MTGKKQDCFGNEHKTLQGCVSILIFFFSLVFSLLRGLGAFPQRRERSYLGVPVFNDELSKCIYDESSSSLRSVRGEGKLLRHRKHPLGCVRMITGWFYAESFL